MSSINNNMDITDKDFENIIIPFYNNYNDFVISYVMPEVIAFYIASSYYRNAMCNATLRQHYNSAKDIFNIDCEDYCKVKKEIVKLLDIKYSLKVISEDPLELKKIEY